MLFVVGAMTGQRINVNRPAASILAVFFHPRPAKSDYACPMTSNSEPTPRIAALVLAAGRASRFGRSKLLEHVDGKSLVARAVDLGASVCGSLTLLVVGHDRRNVRDAAGSGVTAFTINDRYAEGLSTSIRAGVAALEHSADGILLLLADQPAVAKAHLETLVSRFNTERPVATAYRETVGPPAVFPAAAFPALKFLEGDTGAKRLLEDLQADIVPFEAAGIDIDTEDDLRRL